MAMTRLSDPTPRMTLPRALLSEALRLARSPLTAVHLVCGLAAGLACGEYFSVTRWDPALGADAYVQFLGALMPLMSAIVCGLAVDEERAAGRLANLTAVPSRGRAVAAKLFALPFSCYFKQPQPRNPLNFHGHAVCFHRFFEGGKHRPPALICLHIDQINNNNAANVAQSQLSCNLSYGFQVNAERGFLHIFARHHLA